MRAQHKKQEFLPGWWNLPNETKILRGPIRSWNPSETALQSSRAKSCGTLAFVTGQIHLWPWLTYFCGVAIFVEVHSRLVYLQIGAKIGSYFTCTSDSSWRNTHISRIAIQTFKRQKRIHVHVVEASLCFFLDQNEKNWVRFCLDYWNENTQEPMWIALINLSKKDDPVSTMKSIEDKEEKMDTNPMEQHEHDTKAPRNLSGWSSRLDIVTWSMFTETAINHSLWY